MVALRLDHVLTFTSASPVEEALDRYRQAGFVPSPHIAEWSPGLRNGFVNLWPEYLELLCVHDDDAFRTAPAPLRRARDAHRPYGLGFYSDDTARLRDDWVAAGHDLPDAEYLRLETTSTDDPPDFCEVALPVLPGADCFALTSFFPGAAMRARMQVAPNTVFGLSGVTFVADHPAAAADRWRRVLAPDSAVTPDHGSDGHVELLSGVHRFTWFTPEALSARFGLTWSDGPSDIALVHLLAERVDLAGQLMADAGWTVRAGHHGSFVVDPHPSDGIAFELHHGSADAWRDTRARVLGEHLTIERFDTR